MTGLVKVEQFLEHLTIAEIERIILLLGADLYWRDACRSRLINRFVSQENPQWAVTRFSLRDSSLNAALLQARTVPLFASRQVIFVDFLEAVEDGSEEARATVLANLAQYIDRPLRSTLLVLTAEGLDRRAKLFHLLREKALVIELDSDTGPNAATTMAMAREFGVQLDEDVAALLNDLLGADLARIHTELTKLATYVGKGNQITAADVRNLAPRAETRSVWELTEVLASGPRSRVLEILDSLLRSGEAGPKLIGAFAWTYRKLLEAQEFSTRPNCWEAARRLGIRPENVDALIRQARKIPRSQLLHGLVALAEADNRLKSTGVNERAVLEFLMMELTAHLAPALKSPNITKNRE